MHIGNNDAGSSAPRKKIWETDKDRQPAPAYGDVYDVVEENARSEGDPDEIASDVAGEKEEHGNKRSKGKDMNNRSRRRRRSQAKNKGVKIVVGVLAGIVALAAAALIVCAVLVTYWLSDLPAYDDLDSYAANGITTIYASDEKTVLARVYLENRIKLDDDEIPQTMKDALVSIEDERFYEHDGVDMQGVVRAVFSTISGQGMQGGSTLTQQLVRNTVLLDEMQDRTVERKVREMYIAREVEKSYTKDQILSLYLNIVNFGDGCYGLEAASQDYFGKSASQLTLAECALLAGIPNSPTAYDPRVDYDAALERSRLVLDKMLELGYITHADYDDAVASPPEIVEEHDEDYGEVIAPYFVDYVKSLASEDPKYNASDYKQGGLTIYTTLDVDKQEAAESAIEEGLENWEGMDSSLTSVDPDNGHIVAMVGGKDYSENNFNLATQMRRQAGSSFKPFTLMAAMSLGMSPETTFDGSSPAKITDSWTVSNSEGEGYGQTTLKNATTHSINTVYAHVIHAIGAQPVVDMAKACGITSPLSSVESICLGTQGVCTLEMASAYATLAAGGVRHDPVAITKVVDQDNNTVYEHEDDEGVRVMSEALAAKTTEILCTVIESGTGTRGKPSNGQPLAGKTGTSEEARDLWFVGYCPQLSTAIWSGYRDEQPTSGYGGSVSAPIFKLYADQGVLGDIEQFPDVDTSSLKFTDDWKSINSSDDEDEDDD